MNCFPSSKAGQAFRRPVSAAPTASSRWRARRAGETPALRSERGVALVITLILLVVITTLVIAFLALTHRESAAVSGAGATTDAEFAMEAASQRAQGQILASFFAANPPPPAPIPPLYYFTNRPINVMGPDLLVSISSTNGTNRLNPSGMWTNPTPPVFIQTNRAVVTLEDRWYLDLNRNGRYDASGYLPDVDDNGRLVFGQNQQPIIQWRVGDPHWIGVPRDPTQPHGEFNPFIARYAYILLPVGRTLDINWIHNDTKNVQLGPGFTGYFRNQGVGTYEMNLAAFLADLNPDYWTPSGDSYYYAFTNNPSFANTGPAFRDALQILTNRFYQGDKRTLATPTVLFAMTGPLGANYFPADFVNAFADGPLAPFGGSQATASLTDFDDATRPWPGSDGHKHYFTIHDLLDPTRMPDGPPGPDPGFRQRLLNASARVNSEDRYSYYRLLSQLGTDSVPEQEDKLDLNYISVRGFHPTNMVPWTTSNQNVISLLGEKPSELFFHTAADRLLTNEFFRYGITNVRLSRLPGQGIPVFTNGSVFINGNSNNPPIYNSRVHQLLQLTVNIFESTRTNDNTEAWPTVPTVMRPLFERQANGDIYIVAYRDETGRDLRTELAANWFELPSAPASLGADVKFYDIPILIGTRKGIPNFNEFTMNTIAHFSRKVEVEKNAAGDNIGINQMFIMSVSNFFICEMLNSYSNFPNASLAYPRPLALQVGVVSTSVLTNNTGAALVSSQSIGYGTTYPALSWTGGTYRLTATLTNITLPTSIYYERAPNGPGFRPFDNASAATLGFERVVPGTSNRWGIVVSNRFLCLLFENTTGRLLDAYSSARMNSRMDLSRELDLYGRQVGGTPFARMWDPASGISNQIATSSGRNGYGFLNGTEWRDYSEVQPFSTIRAGMDGFAAFLDSTDPPTNRFHQAPFSPNVRLLQVTTWGANDPLVHSTVYDLYDVSPGTNSATARMIPRAPYSIFTNDASTGLSSPGFQNYRYNPWGGRQGAGLSDDFFYAEKDPGVFYPDQWDFPTQKFPNAGWLGRVHRGTPWQTIYLKARDPSYSMASWRAHTGAAYLPDTFPTNDWRLLDIFTAAIHPNATRGRLSINQTNAAAWAAVFGGVPVTAVVGDNNNGYAVFETNIQPASIDWPLQTLVEGINDTRSQLPGGQFNRLSEFMLVTNLTLQSPYISNFVFNASPDIKKLEGYLTDSDYERLPQQILSLVKVGEPRYVIYAWGQSLKPAEYGVRLVGTNVERTGVGIDQSTKTPINYQITGEMATRSVVRVEFEKDALGRTLYHRPHAVVERFNILPNE